VVYQDNQSSILLEKHGQASPAASAHGTLTPDIALLLIGSLEYCPTKEIIVDYFTKPLQGAGPKYPTQSTLHDPFLELTGL
jgi:hypothetical protein